MIKSHWPLALLSLGLGCSSPTIGYSEGLSGTVSLADECSGSIVRFADSSPDDAAMVLTAGHCLDRIPNGISLRQMDDDRAVDLVDRRGDPVGSIRTTRILFATMTSGDIALLRLDRTYAAIEEQFEVSALTLSATPPNVGAEIVIPSGLHGSEDFCTLEALVETVREADWEWHDVLRYSCRTEPGASGSPIRDTATGEVIGVNGTENSSGADNCRLQNPCEVSADGSMEGFAGIAYGHDVSVFNTCRAVDGTFDPGAAGCMLP